MRQDEAMTDDDAATRSGRLERDGYVMLRSVLSPDRVARLNAAVDSILAREPAAEAYNVRCAVERDPLIAELIEEAGPLDLIVNHLGYNLQLHSSQLSIRRPLAPEDAPAAGERRRLGVGRMVSLDWHRDGPAPQFPRVEAYSAKVCFILSDMGQAGRGNTKVIPGSHLRPGFHPGHGDPRHDPPGAVEILGAPGDAFVFTQNLWHAAAPNLSAVERRLVFIGYSAFWARPLDVLTDPSALLAGASDVRHQLIGEIGTAPAHRIVPTDDMMPLKRYWRGASPVWTYA